jgi:beta-lactamase regulating signal transducer with metallopeptidase domain
MRALLDIGLANALVATVMAVGAAVLARVCRRPALTHALWVLVLLKLVAPPLVSLPIALPKTRAPQSETVTVASAADDLDSNDDLVEVPAEEALRSIDAAGGWVNERDRAVLAQLAPQPNGSGAATAAGPGKFVAILRQCDWRVVVAAIWLTGSLFWVISAGVRIRRFQRALKVAEPAPPWLQTQVDKLADRVGMATSPTVWLVPGAISPLVWALGGSASLLVPAKLWDRLDEEQRSTLLIHELAHLRRKDHWVRALELVATGLFWWHPVVWWARRAMREAEEQCCDAWVVWAKPGAAKAYATALLETVDFLSQARPALPLAASGIGHVEHLKRRLTMILKGMTPKGLSWAGRLGVFGLAGALLPLVPTAAQDPAPEPKKIEILLKDTQPVQEVVRSDVFVVTADDDDKDGPKDENVQHIVSGDAVVRLDLKIDANDDDKDDEDDKDSEKLKRDKKEKDEADAQAKAEFAKARAELDRARAEVRKAQAELAKSAKALAELEAKHSRTRTTRTRDGKVVIIEDRDGGPRSVRLPKGMVGIVAPNPPNLPQAIVPPTAVRARAITLPMQGFEKRLDALEKKLDKVIDELKSQKKKETGANDTTIKGTYTAISAF